MPFLLYASFHRLDFLLDKLDLFLVEVVFGVELAVDLGNRLYCGIESRRAIRSYSFLKTALLSYWLA